MDGSISMAAISGGVKAASAAAAKNNGEIMAKWRSAINARTGGYRMATWRVSITLAQHHRRLADGDGQQREWRRRAQA